MSRRTKIIVDCDICNRKVIEPAWVEWERGRIHLKQGEIQMDMCMDCGKAICSAMMAARKAHSDEVEQV